MSADQSNDPRNGPTDMVTREHLDRLRDERSTPNLEMHYTIGGTIETAVHSRVDAQRDAAIAKGERTLATASHDMRTEVAIAANEGRAQAEFEQVSADPMDERMQRLEALQADRAAVEVQPEQSRNEPAPGASDDTDMQSEFERAAVDAMDYRAQRVEALRADMPAQEMQSEPNQGEPGR